MVRLPFSSMINATGKSRGFIIKQIARKMNRYTQRFSQIPKILGLFAHTYFLAILIVDEPSRLMTVKIRGGNDEIGHVE